MNVDDFIDVDKLQAETKDTVNFVIHPPAHATHYELAEAHLRLAVLSENTEGAYTNLNVAYGYMRLSELNND